jgi:multidrug efflux pump subunit AcrA (membrane-fusion protein)
VRGVVYGSTLLLAAAVLLTACSKQAEQPPKQELASKPEAATGQTFVNVANADGTFTEVVVKLGAQGSDYSEVIEGLYEGDTVALLAGSTNR